MLLIVPLVQTVTGPGGGRIAELLSRMGVAEGRQGLHHLGDEETELQRPGRLGFLLLLTRAHGLGCREHVT